MNGQVTVDAAEEIVVELGWWQRREPNID